MGSLASELALPLGGDDPSTSTANRRRRAGRDLAMTRVNPSTGRFDFDWTDRNDLKFDDTQTHRVVSLLLERRGQWWADTEGNRGSRLYTLRDLRRSTPSQAEAFAQEALARAVSDGWIRDPVVKARVPSPGRLLLDPVRWTLPGGRQVSTRIAMT